jgi:PTH1 family peptidyl-tRNA hydrolase
MSLKLIVGLGNPGRRYKDTRHNVGFAVADELARRSDVAFESAPADALMARSRRLGLIVKPLTMMNLSGHAVSAIARYFKIELADVFVIADEVSLPLGRLRARPRGSDGGHRGLRSVIGALGSSEFARLRVGIGRGDPRRDLADYVLAGFDAEERPVVLEAVSRAADAAELFVDDGIESVMNRFNPDPRRQEEEGAAPEK